MMWMSRPLRGKGMLCKGISYCEENKPSSSIKSMYEPSIKDPHTTIFTDPKRFGKSHHVLDLTEIIIQQTF